MMAHDWTFELEFMTRKELIEFAILTMGILSTYGEYAKMTPQEVFEKIMEREYD